MNKKILAGIVSVVMIMFMTGISIANLLTNSDDTVEITKDAKTTLSSVGINNPQTSELVCDGSNCKFSMWDGSYKLGTHSIPEEGCIEYSECGELEPDCEIECLEWRVYITEELQGLKNEKIVEKLEFYAGVIKERAERTSETKLGKGTITIQEKK